MYADLCVMTPDCGNTLDIAAKLNLDMVGLIVSVKEIPALREAQKKRDWRLKPRLALGIDASSQGPHDMKKTVLSVRKHAEIIVVRGGTDELNRQAVETPEIDILLNHDVNGRSGINHVLAKLARENNVAIGFDMNQLMTSYRLGRIQEFSSMIGSAQAVRKYNAPFVLTSGARDAWDMRSASELLALGSQLGFTEAQSRKGLSDSMVRENKKRLSGKWVMPGVEVE